MLSSSPKCTFLLKEKRKKSLVLRQFWTQNPQTTEDWTDIIIYEFKFKSFDQSNHPESRQF